MLWLGSLPRCGDMQTVILCGGTGVRAMPSTLEVPKPLLLVGDRPVLTHVMEIYADQGFTDFVLAAGYKAEPVWKFAQSLPASWHVEVVDTGEETWELLVPMSRSGLCARAKSSRSRFWPTQDGVIANCRSAGRGVGRLSRLRLRLRLRRRRRCTSSHWGCRSGRRAVEPAAVPAALVQWWVDLQAAAPRAHLACWQNRALRRPECSQRLRVSRQTPPRPRSS
jgi:hypothetical protein